MLDANLCRADGCMTPVAGTRGLGAYCPEHRSKRARTAPGPKTLAEKLDDLKGLARDADRLEAKAKKLRQAADQVALEAGDKRDELNDKMRALTTR